MIAFPYPKYLNAMLETDQAACCLILSVAEARALGIAEDRWVYWWGGADAEEEAWWPSERPDFATCPSMLDSTLGALQQAELEMGDIDHIDFYSCFPVAVEMACHMLGIDQDDPRGFSVTGGLPYAGGPGSAYTLHSLASMADVLRDAPGDKGLVTGNGWYLTKHASSIWSGEPKPGAAPSGELPESRPSRGFETAPAVAAQDASGPATAEAYTVVYDRAGAPERGIVLGRLGDGHRFLANTPADRALLEDFVAREEIGRQGTVSRVDGRTIFDPS
jgi:acetyl-CoA C-acetyltransferase